MALQKDYTLENGSTGNYWRLSSFKFIKFSMTVYIKLGLFKDSTFTSPLFEKEFTFTVTQQELVGNMPSICYQKIIDFNDPDLTGAQSV